ncbi:MAG: septum formation inhibitor Maf [Clostridia bacterium]|nr:septum formation inhibitor Maf [Clostridia bacterium]
MSKLILASASPRRRELMALAGFDFEVITADVDEVLDPSLEPCELVMSLAFQKASAVAEYNPDAAVIGADTVVVLDGKVLGKPHSEEEAVQMLRELSGNTHEVYTGVCIIKGDRVHKFYECTGVTFQPLEDELITQYVASKEPMDKAGSYGIQGKGSVLVKGIEGDYFNVVGFPVSRFYREIKPFT